MPAIQTALEAAREQHVANYFAKPPAAHLLILSDGQYSMLARQPTSEHGPLWREVLASPNPWRWDTGFGLFINQRTGDTRDWIGPGKPTAKSTDPKYDPRTINAEVRVSQTKLGWLESGIGLEGDVGKIVYAEGVARKLRGDRGAWAEQQRPLKRAEQRRRAKSWHFSMRNVVPKDYMTDEDRKVFAAQARECMANIMHLTHSLPQCKILASKLTLRMLEMIEWEMINVAEWGRGLTEKIEAELRADGAHHGTDNLRVDRWEQQREGARFQYHWLGLVFKAWSQQMVDVMLEYGGLMQSTQHHGRLGVEHNGNTWEYVPVLLRQKEKKQRKREVELRSAAHRAALVGKPPEEFEKYYARYTGMKPRKARSVHDQATPEVAQPMSEGEAGWMDEDGHHAGYAFDDDGNVVD